MATTIKVDRLVLLQALTTRYDEEQKKNAEYNKAIAKYEKDEKAYHDKVITLSKKWQVDGVRNVSDLPAEPEKPDYPKGMMPATELEELGKVIKLLNMTADPSVPASVYKNVSQWL
jgi:hypothetical protein